MRRTWTIAIALASLVGASSAAAQGSAPPPARPGQGQGQGQGQGSQQNQGQNKGQHQGSHAPGAQSANKAYESAKHIAVINAGLRDGALNSQMLADISADSRSYDRTHGEVFLGNIKRSVTEAEAHLAHLQPMATTTEEKNQLKELSQHLTKAKSMFQPMTNQLNDPKAINKSATELDKELKAGIQPLQQVAKEMNSKIEIG